MPIFSHSCVSPLGPLGVNIQWPFYLISLSLTVQMLSCPFLLYLHFNLYACCLNWNILFGVHSFLYLSIEGSCLLNMRYTCSSIVNWNISFDFLNSTVKNISIVSLHYYWLVNEIVWVFNILTLSISINITSFCLVYISWPQRDSFEG